MALTGSHVFVRMRTGVSSVLLARVIGPEYLLLLSDGQSSQKMRLYRLSNKNPDQWCLKSLVRTFMHASPMDPEYF